MVEWYRNTEWSEQTAAAFEARLARSRAQKAQYLLLQGQALIAGHPKIAEGLLQRVVAMDDALHTVRALAFLAQARLALGDLEGTLLAYERGLELQLATPNIIAVHPADYVFVVGYFGCQDRLLAALPIAEALPDEGIFGPDPQAQAAKAMVFDLAGKPDAARCAAAKALPLFADLGDAAALGVDVAELRRRLAAIAEG